MTNCEIILDLLPLYHDNACSQASRALVEDHVAACEACRAQLDDLEAPVPLAPVPSFLPPPSRLRQAKNKLVRKAALTVTAIFCALGVFTAGWLLFYAEFEKERVIAWDDGPMLAGAGGWEEPDGTYGMVTLNFRQERYVRASCLFRRVTVEGETRDVAILQFTQSWAREWFDTSVGGPEQVAMGTGTGLYISRGGQRHDIAYGPEYEPAYWDPRWEYPGALSAVYYLDTLSPLELRDAPEASVLSALEQHGRRIWEDGRIV